VDLTESLEDDDEPPELAVGLEDPV
jgi:hypothetical protein